MVYQIKQQEGNEMTKFEVLVYPINGEPKVVDTFPTYEQARSRQAECRRMKEQSSIRKVEE